jgi:hypothetical protein
MKRSPELKSVSGQVTAKRAKSRRTFEVMAGTSGLKNLPESIKTHSDPSS